MSLLLPTANFRGGVIGKKWATGSSLLPLHSKLVIIGHSIVAARGFAGYGDWLLFHSRGRFFCKAVGSNGLGPTGWNQGVSGNTGDMVNARLQNVIDENPAEIIVDYGTNDIGAAGLTGAQVLTRYATTYNTLRAALPNARIRFCTILPRTAAGWNQGMDDQRIIANNGIKANYSYIDMASVITNPATQLSDGTHPNVSGAQPMGQLAATVLSGDIVTDDILYSLPTAPAENLFANPFFTGGTTSATSWSFFQNTNGLTKAASKTTDGAYAAQKIVWSGTATSNVADNFNQNVTPPGGLAGELYECWMELIVTRLTGMAGMALAAGNNGGGYTAMSISSQDTSGGIVVPFRGVLRAPPSPLVSNGGALNMRLSFLPANGAVVDAEVAFLRAGARKVAA